MVGADDPENVAFPPTQSEAQPPSESDGWEWGIVEIFGHRKHAGRTREEERFGAKMLRIDIPIKGDPAANGWATSYYGGASIFSFALSDEKTVLRMNRPYDSPYRLTHRETEEDEPSDGDGRDEQTDLDL